MVNSASVVVAYLSIAVLMFTASNGIHGVSADAVQDAAGRLLVNMTLIPNAVAFGAVCLDGSPPAYHLHKGSGDGSRNWLLQFEGGGWCNDVSTCIQRASTRLGSTKFMNRLEVFSGILSDDPQQNPDFYSWNRVKLRYCDGGSFAGDSQYELVDNTVLYFRGQRIWHAIISDLLPKGLSDAEKVLLGGCSAGGLSTFFHCDDLSRRLSRAKTVKCLSDAGFFLDLNDINGNNTAIPFYSSLVALQGVEKNLNPNCLVTVSQPYQCFFPQYALPSIRTPYFILNSAYDTYQFHHIFVPPSADPLGRWSRCKQNPQACSPAQISTLQGLRTAMLDDIQRSFNGSERGGMYINSCFAHCQSESQDTWLAPNSPRLHDKTIAQAVGDWYFERSDSCKDVDCPYPCDSTCHNLIPQ